MFPITELAVRTLEPHFSATFLRPASVISCQWRELWANGPSETIRRFGNKPTAGPAVGGAWRRWPS